MRADIATVEDLDLTRNRVRCIGAALMRTRGIQTEAARLLGITPRVLNHMLSAYGLRRLIDIGKLAIRDEGAASDLLARFLVDYVPIVDSNAKVGVR